MANALGKPAASEKAPSQTSAKTYEPVGSGSRPGAAKMPIDVSSSADCHTQGRAPSGWLK